MKTEIILLGHGSRRAEANQGLLVVADKVSALLGQKVTPAYMAHDHPSLPEAAALLRIIRRSGYSSAQACL